VSALLSIARLTLMEALRRRVVMAAVLLGAAYLLFFGVGLHFIHHDVQRDMQAQGVNASVARAVLSTIVTAGLYAGNLLAMMASVLVALETLAGEIGSGVVETLCTKPVRRATILVGKWLGCAALVSAYVTFLLGGVLLTARFVAGFTPPNVQLGMPLIVLEGVLLTTLALAVGTRLSPLASGMVVFSLYGLALIGGWIEQIGTFVGNATARSVGILASLLMPSEALWQRASFLMQPALARDIGMSPFTVGSLPSPAMVLWAAGFVVVALVAAMRLFTTRDL
jgi:Cu-processing system permease protein